MHQESPRYRILLVEDDGPLASMVAEFLGQQGCDTAIERRGDAAVGRILAEIPDAVLLDVNLPGLDGFSICRNVREKYAGVIIMLTARGEEVDEVLGLEAGADDYLAKPVRPRALLARLQSHLRRAVPGERAVAPLVVGSLVVDDGQRRATIGGREVNLTTAEFDLLLLLAKHAGCTVSRKDLYLQLQGMKYDGLDRSIDLRISRLRKKLGDDPLRPKRIKSVRGAGYLLSVEP
jgi:two-component system OmpR family response regulator/two-component system response regulator RstA